MSNSTPTQTNQFRFRLPPIETLITFGIAAAMLGVCAVQFDDFKLPQLLLLGAFFIVGILAQRAWAIYIMLGTYILLKYFLIHPLFKTKLHQLRPSDAFLVLILILLAAMCFRFVESGRFLQAFYPNASFGDKPKSGNRNEFPSLLGGRWWAIPLAILLACGLLTVFPFNMQFFENARIEQRASRLIFFTLTLFFGWFICRSAVGIFIRRRMKVVQADVQCRSLIAKEMWKDVYAIEKRRSKIQSRD